MPRIDLASVAMTISTACAISVTVVFLKNELAGKPHGSLREMPSPRADTTRVANWSEDTIGGHRIGGPNGRVTMVMFTDFECPFCQRFARSTLRSIRDEFRDSVAIIIQEWPLKMHRFAYPAARAAECAAAQDRFEQFHDLLFVKQDSLGLKSFRSFAAESGVPNLQIFDRCDARVTAVPAIELGIQKAGRSGAHGTPFVIVDGLGFPGGADSTKLTAYIRALLKSPAAAKR